MERRNYTTKLGFTLIELLVSLTLFTIVITMAVGTLLVLIDANAKAQNMQEVMTNLTFALDSMTREIRTGRAYFCAGAWLDSNTPNDTQTRDCTRQEAFSIVEGGSSLTESGNPRITYRFKDGGIDRRIGTGSWQPLTSEDVNITNMYFTVKNTDTYLDNNDTVQPTVTIFVEGEAGVLEGIDTSFSMQTTITRRLLDI